jgi:peptide chain release factor 1
MQHFPGNPRRNGGDEAALFAGNLFRMYQKYAESKGWSTEVISQSQEHGGFKEIIVLMEGEEFIRG